MVVGGLLDRKAQTLAWVFNIKTKSISQINSMNQKRSAFGIINDYQNQEVYIIGGHDSNDYLAHCEKYMIQSDEWISITPMNQKKMYASACILNNQFIFSIGGFNKGKINDIQRYSINSS